MRFLRALFRFIVVVLICLWLVTPSWSSGDVLCLSGENQPKLRRRNESFSSRAVADAAQARALLSPAVLVGTLRSVLVQRDGAVRAWFKVDSVLKRSPEEEGRGARTARMPYSRKRYTREYFALPAVRLRDWSAYGAYDVTTRAGGATYRRSARTLRSEDTEVVYSSGGQCPLEVNQDNLRLGAQYVVFGVPSKRHSWPSLVASALPIPNDKRILRAVKKVLCEGCEFHTGAKASCCGIEKQKCPIEVKECHGGIESVCTMKCSQSKPPSIEGVEDVSVEEGVRVRLRCRVWGNPLPWVEWFKEGKRITTRGRLRVKTRRRTSRLVIRRSRLSDGGVYECRAGNVLQKEPVTATATLLVTRHRRRNKTTTLPATSTSTQSSPWTTEPCRVSDFCNNGGTCVFYKDVQEYVCHCAEGYVGLRCDYKDVRVSVGEVKNVGLSHDRLLIIIVILFLIFFCANWAGNGICWLCFLRSHHVDEWGKFREMAPLRWFFRERSDSSKDGASLDVAVELTPSATDEN